MHTYVYICDCTRACIQEAEQPSRRALTSAKGHNVRQEKKQKQNQNTKNPSQNNPHVQNLPQKNPRFWKSCSVELKIPQILMWNEALIAQVLHLQLSWNVQWDELLVKQMV